MNRQGACLLYSSIVRDRLYEFRKVRNRTFICWCCSMQGGFETWTKRSKTAESALWQAATVLLPLLLPLLLFKSVSSLLLQMRDWLALCSHLGPSSREVCTRAANSCLEHKHAICVLHTASQDGASEDRAI